MVHGLDIFRERFRGFAGPIPLDRSCLLDLLPQLLRPSLVTGLVPARASLTPRLAEASASQSLPSQLNRPGFGESLVLIGGAACDEWFRRLGMRFRATQDLDIVLILEAVNGDFVAAMRGFVAEGGYAVRQRSDGGPPILYRFSKPQDARFPAMLEIFSRLPEGVELSADQAIVPIPTGEGPHSLSAILVHPDYHALIREQRETRDGIAFANATALIPLKAKAWLDLSARRAAAEAIDARDIAKHRADVFRLAATLPGGTRVELPEPIRADLETFLASFPEGAPDWAAILDSIRKTVGGDLSPAMLREAIRAYFALTGT